MNNFQREKPLVTIAIPTFNRRSLLERTLNSVLGQSYNNLEIIVSDNASTDDTRAYLESITDARVKKLYSEKNVGMVRNWDKCLDNAHGAYFLLISDDDMLWDKNAVDLFVCSLPLDDDHQTSFVFSDVAIERGISSTPYVPKISGPLIYRPAELITDFFNNKVSVFPCATFFRTRDLRAVGGYGESGAILAVDACAWISISTKYATVSRIDRPLSLYRVHPSLSSSGVQVWSADLGVIRRQISEARNSFSSIELKDIEKALRASWNRSPLGYIARKWREDHSYSFKDAIVDAFAWRGRVFSGSNILWALGWLFRSFVVERRK